jgi:hypothetical protein
MAGPRGIGPNQRSSSALVRTTSMSPLMERVALLGE